MTCEVCGAGTHRDDAMDRRCNDCEHIVRLCICKPPKDKAVPHGPDEPCTCPGCWACKGHVVGCTCDIDWDAVTERRMEEGK